MIKLFVNHKELLEKIDGLSREEGVKKQTLISGFSAFKKEMMPGAIAKGALQNSIKKIKSLLPNFLSGSKQAHATENRI